MGQIPRTLTIALSPRAAQALGHLTSLERQAGH